MNRQDLIDAAEDEIERTLNELQNGWITKEKCAEYISNIEHNLAVDLEDFGE